MTWIRQVCRCGIPTDCNVLGVTRFYAKCEKQCGAAVDVPGGVDQIDILPVHIPTENPLQTIRSADVEKVGSDGAAAILLGDAYEHQVFRGTGDVCRKTQASTLQKVLVDLKHDLRGVFFGILLLYCHFNGHALSIQVHPGAHSKLKGFSLRAIAGGNLTRRHGALAYVPAKIVFGVLLTIPGSGVRK